MINKTYKLFFLFAMMLFVAVIGISSCKNKPQESADTKLDDPEKLMEINKAFVNEEQEHISDYIVRYNYKMEETKTGLHLMHINKGNGKKPAMNSDITISYKINLLDGTYCYSSDSSGLLTFRLGQSTEPSGLQEGILHMNEGGSSLMIIPSYLAYGITGDGDKIRSNQSLVYKVELLEVK